jgi:D-glycerate 3-kinase
VTALETTLRSSPYNLPTLTLSIDDLYLTHAAQTALAKAHPRNPLVQHRGEPSTHDVALGKELFRKLRNKESDIRIPFYDKSMHDGKGDRVDESEWRTVNRKDEEKVEVIIFEGWCVGFRHLTDEDIIRKRQNDVAIAEKEDSEQARKGRLSVQREEDLLFVNEALRSYDEMTE